MEGGGSQQREGLRGRGGILFSESLACDRYQDIDRHRQSRDDRSQFRWAHNGIQYAMHGIPERIRWHAYTSNRGPPSQWRAERGCEYHGGQHLHSYTCTEALHDDTYGGSGSCGSGRSGTLLLPVRWL